MALPTYASPLERIWHYTYLVICGLVFLFLIAPILIVIPLSLQSDPAGMYLRPPSWSWNSESRRTGAAVSRPRARLAVLAELTPDVANTLETSQLLTYFHSSPNLAGAMTMLRVEG